MYTVYILKSLRDPTRHYVGSTHDLVQRLKEHNGGKSVYTRSYAPWEVETYLVFKDKKTAQKFEKYLKHGSGHAFLKKRLIPL